MKTEHIDVFDRITDAIDNLQRVEKFEPIYPLEKLEIQRMAQDLERMFALKIDWLQEQASYPSSAGGVEELRRFLNGETQ